MQCTGTELRGPTGVVCNISSALLGWVQGLQAGECLANCSILLAGEESVCLCYRLLHLAAAQVACCPCCKYVYNASGVLLCCRWACAASGFHTPYNCLTTAGHQQACHNAVSTHQLACLQQLMLAALSWVCTFCFGDGFSACTAFLQFRRARFDQRLWSRIFVLLEPGSASVACRMLMLLCLALLQSCCMAALAHFSMSRQLQLMDLRALLHLHGCRHCFNVCMAQYALARVDGDAAVTCESSTHCRRAHQWHPCQHSVQQGARACTRQAI
jgi:hypothetical protein